MGIAAEQAVGVYVSVPFCRAKCTFCNFSSDVGSAAQLERYVGALCREMRSARTRAEAMGLHLPECADTVYFGGGTPSLLTPGQLQQIFATLRESFLLAPAAEITMEAAPGQIDGDLLEQAQRLGVNRISLGVQSFVDHEAAAVGRLHTGPEAMAEVTRLARAGVAERGIDLIAGLPQQSAASWQQSLDMAAECDITHLSVYMLEIDEESRLGREVLAGGTRFHAHAVADDDLIADLYETACAWLPANSFEQYEISNFARSSRTGTSHQSQHNRKYWARAPYLGFGLDAHSMLLRSSDARAVRFRNSDEMHDFEMGVSGAKALVVSERDAFEEAVFLGLRLNEGIGFNALRERWPEDWVAECELAATDLLADDLLQTKAGKLVLTVRGRLLSNDIFGHLLSRVPA